jgi:hypothetical protein
VPSSPLPRVSRRATLGGLVTALGGGPILLLVGCDAAPAPEGPASSATETGTRLATAERDDEEVDADLLDRVVAATTSAESLLAATVVQHPGLAGALRGLQAMHAAHRELLAASLDGDPTGAVLVPPVPGRSRRALAVVRRHENDLQRQLAELALDARSGQFARILASMAAAVGQHVSTLPRPGQAGPA